jgi:RNA polymerase sigma factor (sigma-70 family)
MTFVFWDLALHNGAMSDVTRILSQIESGDPSAAEQLLPLVYDELRKLAAAKLAQEKPGQTLQATALVHDAYLRLVKPGVRSQELGVGEEMIPDFQTPTPDFWHSRGHFFAAAAEAMRRILVDRARQKRGPMRGGDRVRVSLDMACDVPDERSEELLAVSDALAILAAESPLKADLVKLRFFVGMSHQEAAEALGISRATADRYWAYAKAFLYSALEDAGGR